MDYKNMRFTELEEYAQQGDGEALLELGWCYEIGKDCTKNESKAFELYINAVRANNIKAPNRVGICYDIGIGVSKNRKEAIYWYKEAIKLNDANAYFGLADIYAKQWKFGIAMDYFKKAVELGCESARDYSEFKVYIFLAKIWNVFDKIFGYK